MVEIKNEVGGQPRGYHFDEEEICDFCGAPAPEYYLWSLHICYFCWGKLLSWKIDSEDV